ncbi:helix-turn-helix transcriptional regulator, partial [Pseudomonas nitroreducens]|uniref:helix-turn-helix transcriptional regulator n=1 Tax=Pseudomonas nitroreducens TaxID=46680 RepID=UPI001551701C
TFFLIGIEDLASMIGLSPRTIKNKVSAHPTSLPPRTYLPAAPSLVRWNVKDVEKWIQSLQRGYGAPEATRVHSHLEETPLKRKRGRPTKASVIAKQRAALEGDAQ